MKAVLCKTPSGQIVVKIGKEKPKLSKGFREIRRFTMKWEPGCKAVIQKFDKPRDRNNQIRLNKDVPIDRQLEQFIGDRNNVEIPVVGNSGKDKSDVKKTPRDGFQRGAPNEGKFQRGAPKEGKNVETQRQRLTRLLNQSENAVSDVFQYWRGYLEGASSIQMMFRDLLHMSWFMERTLPTYALGIRQEEEINMNLMEKRIKQFSDLVNELGEKCCDPETIQYYLSNEKKVYCIFYGGILKLLTKLSDKDKNANTLLINELIKRERHVYSSVSAIASASKRDGFAKKVETWTGATCNMTEKDEMNFAEITSGIFSC